MRAGSIARVPAADPPDVAQIGQEALGAPDRPPHGGEVFLARGAVERRIGQRVDADADRAQRAAQVVRDDGEDGVELAPQVADVSVDLAHQTSSELDQ